MFRDRQIGARWSTATRSTPRLTPLEGVPSRASYGVESGPWIGRVPTGWIATELARVASSIDADFRLVGSEGSILVFPAGVVWLDHGALGSIQLGAIGRIRNFEVESANMGKRFDRRVLARLHMGDIWFDVGQAAAARLQQSIHDAELEAQALPADDIADRYSWLGLSVLMPSLRGLPNWQRIIQTPFGRIEGFLGTEGEEGNEEVSEVQLSQPGMGLYSATGELLGMARFSDMTDIWRDGPWLAANFGSGRVALRAGHPDEFEEFMRSRQTDLKPGSD